MLTSTRLAKILGATNVPGKDLSVDKRRVMLLNDGTANVERDSIRGRDDTWRRSREPENPNHQLLTHNIIMAALFQYQCLLHLGSSSFETFI